MIAVDTNVVSELMRREPEAEVVRWAASVADADLAVPAVVVAELLHGLGRLPAGARRQRLEGALDAFFHRLGDDRVLPLDGPAAVAHGHITSGRELSGRPVSAMDALIAATCRTHGARLATRNTKDFAGTGVELIDPWAAGRSR